MGNLNNSLKMLFILKSRGLVKIKDLADELEVSSKQITRYKETLDEFFDIESITGKNGGYRLRDTYFPFKEILTEQEVHLIKEAVLSIDSSLLQNNPDLNKAIEKINYTILNDDNSSSNYESIIPYSRIKKNDEKFKEIEDKLYSSIFGSEEAVISYKDNSGKITERTICPYQFIVYKGEKYLVAFCLLRNQIRFFKIRRIINCRLTDKKFKKDIDVKKVISDYRKNSIGIFGGEEYDLELEIKYPMANTIKERLWVDNQEVDETKYKDRIIFKAKMKGGPEIISWILSMGDCVKIIKPLKLKEEIHKKLENMIQTN